MGSNLERKERRILQRSAVVDAVLKANARVGRVESIVFKRGFWGRLKWLALGR